MHRMPHSVLLKQQLAETDAFLVDAADRIARHEVRLLELPQDDPARKEISATLVTFRRSLDVMRRHRDLIAEQLNAESRLTRTLPADSSDI